MLDIIMSMYKNIKSRVKFDNKLSQEFSCMTGVRQGECLSPIIFALYLNDLEQELITSGADGVDTGLLKLFLLLYADDIIIIMKEDSYSEPAIRRVEMSCSPEHIKPLETRLFYRTKLIFFCFYEEIFLQPCPTFMHRSFAKLLPWFYILGAQKNRFIEMVLHMF